MIIKNSLLLITVSTLLWAANLDAFLDNGVGIQGPAMGGANFRSVGIESAWSAPARLALMKQSQVAFVLNKKWDFLEEIWLGGAMPIASGVLGYQYFNSRSGASILGTIYDPATKQNQLTGADYSYYASMLQMTYAQILDPTSRWALGLRLQNKVLGPVAANSIGLDAAADWSLTPQLNASLKITNLVATPYQWVTEKEQPVLGWLAGLGYQSDAQWSINAGLQGNGPDIKWLAGTEYNIDQSLFLRAGINRDELSAGFSLQMESVGFDYSFQHVLAGEGLMNSIHRMGVSWIFDGPPAPSEVATAKTAVEEAQTTVENDMAYAVDATVLTNNIENNTVSLPEVKTLVKPVKSSFISDIVWSGKKWSIQGLAEGVTRLDQNDAWIAIRPDKKYFHKGIVSDSITLRYSLASGQIVSIRMVQVGNVLRLEGSTDIDAKTLMMGNQRVNVGADGRFLMTVPLKKGEAKFQFGLSP